MNGYDLTTDWLRARAVATPNLSALIVAGRVWTFRQLDSLVSSLSVDLQNEGVTPGEHVGSLMPNTLAAVCCVFAMARLGAVLVPLNSRLTATELAWQIDRADCNRLICQPETEAVGRQAIDNRLPLHVLPDSSQAFEDMLRTLAEGELPAQSAEIGLDALQAIVFTSGTTGFPKGAMITYANHFWSAVGSAFRLGVIPGDRWLACLPLYHVGGLAILFRSCLYGTTVVLQDGFDVGAVLDSLRDEAISIVSLVPTMLTRLLNAGLDYGMTPSLRLVLLGGAAASPDLLTESAAAGLPVAITYGLTEATSQVATLLPDGACRKPGSAGRPLIFSDITILDENGGAADIGVPGEIVVRGPTVMAGYFGDKDATSTAIRNGRLHTGDVGYLDEDGDLWVLDRRNDLIVSGGENVYPAEVEGVLRRHPAVMAACVVGLPHPEWGRQVAAMVVLRQTGVISAAELQDFSRERLAGYKQPRTIFFADELPLTGSGKIQRGEVAARLLSLMEAV